MLMRRMRRGAVLATAAAALLLAPARPRVEDLVLVKLDRQQPPTVPASALDEAAGVLELDSGWVAAVAGELRRRLQAAGASLTVLDEAPSERHHFLVFGASDADLAALPAGSRATRLERDVAFVASASDALRPMLPAHLGLAALSLSPASLVGPLFERVGQARAAPRAQAASSLSAVDPRLGQAVANISSDRLGSLVRALESYQTRYATTTAAAAAGNYLYDQFRQLGLTVEYDDFTFSSANYPASNIVATLPGRSSPRDIVIVCAHYDSYSDQRPAVAPGADDNASGTAAVLEAARVLAAVPLDFTIRFIAFSAEEFGLYGSAHYAQEARARGERILAVVNLDMIGFADQLPEDLDVIGNPDSEWLVDRVRSVAAAYTSLPVLKTISASARSSDHAPFWDRGYDAVLCIEDLPLRNPYYHRATDRLETLSLPFATVAARTAAAVVGDLAQPVGALPAPTGLSVQTEVFRSLFSRARRSVLQWSPVPGAVGYYVYRASTSHGTYRRLTTVPVQSPFADGFLPVSGGAFYVVAAVDWQLRESNYSAEGEAR